MSAIADFMREMVRQVGWMDLASIRDDDAECLAECGGEWPHGYHGWNKVINGDGLPAITSTPSKSRVWTRMDLRRFARAERWRKWEAAGQPEAPPHEPEARVIRTRVQAIRWRLPSIERFKGLALAEAHKKFPAIVSLVVAAFRAHNDLLDAYSASDWNRLDREKHRHERAINRINEHLPEPIPNFDLYFFGQLNRTTPNTRNRRSECPYCGKFESLVTSTPHKGGNVSTQYLKCEACGRTWNRPRRKK